MTEDEIIKVSKIMLTADYWCSICVRELIEQLQRAFPEYADTINGIHQHMDTYRTLNSAAWDAWDHEGSGPNIWDIYI